MVAVKGYVISVLDFECDELSIEGVYKNVCEAIKEIGKIAQELYENAFYNENKTVKLEYFFDDNKLINKIIISGNDIKLFEIKLEKTTIK